MFPFLLPFSIVVKWTRIKGYRESPIKTPALWLRASSGDSFGVTVNPSGVTQANDDQPFISR